MNAVMPEVVYKFIRQSQWTMYSIKDGGDEIASNDEVQNEDDCIAEIKEFLNLCEGAYLTIVIRSVSKSDVAKGGNSNKSRSFKIRLPNSMNGGYNNRQQKDPFEVSPFLMKLLESNSDAKLELIRLENKMAMKELELKYDKKNAVDPVQQEMAGFIKRMMDNEFPEKHSGLGALPPAQNNNMANLTPEEKQRQQGIIRQALIELAKVDSELYKTLYAMAKLAQQMPQRYLDEAANMKRTFPIA